MSDTKKPDHDSALRFVALPKYPYLYSFILNGDEYINLSCPHAHEGCFSKTFLDSIKNTGGKE